MTGQEYFIYALEGGEKTTTRAMGYGKKFAKCRADPELPNYPMTYLGVSRSHDPQYDFLHRIRMLKATSPIEFKYRYREAMREKNYPDFLEDATFRKLPGRYDSLEEAEIAMRKKQEEINRSGALLNYDMIDPSRIECEYCDERIRSGSYGFHLTNYCSGDLSNHDCFKLYPSGI